MNSMSALFMKTNEKQQLSRVMQHGFLAGFELKILGRLSGYR